MKWKAVEDVILYSDNKMSITLTKNIEGQHRTKYINVKHHYIKKLINMKKLTIEWILGLKMLADRMTKSLPTKTFRKY